MLAYVILEFRFWPLCEPFDPIQYSKKKSGIVSLLEFRMFQRPSERSTKAGIFRKECNKSCQLIQSGEGVRVLNSISVGETFFPLHFCESLDTFLGQVKKLSKSMECVWWDCKSEKWEKEGRVMNICLFFSFSCHFHLSCFWYFCLFEPWN